MQVDIQLLKNQITTMYDLEASVVRTANAKRGERKEALLTASDHLNGVINLLEEILCAAEKSIVLTHSVSCPGENTLKQ